MRAPLGKPPEEGDSGSGRVGALSHQHLGPLVGLSLFDEREQLGRVDGAPGVEIVELVRRPNADAIDPRYRVLFLTGTYTGLRFGELAALRTHDLDLLRRTFRVDEQLSRQGSWKMVAGPLKSKKAYRTIGIPAFLCEELASHLTEYPSGSDLVFSHAREARSTTTASVAETGTQPSRRSSARRALPTTSAFRSRLLLYDRPGGRTRSRTPRSRAVTPGIHNVRDRHIGGRPRLGHQRG